MRFLEKNLEHIIFETDGLELCERGLYFGVGTLLRQVRIGNYGIADLILVERTFNNLEHYYNRQIKPELQITVFELKKGEVGMHALLQACGYVTGIKHFLSKRNFEFPVTFSIILIGSYIENDQFIHLSNWIENPLGHQGVKELDLYTYEYKVDGIRFKRHYNSELQNPGF